MSKIGYSAEDLAKMPKEKREQILQGRKERELALKTLAKRDLDNSTVELSERAYNGKFKASCKNIRAIMQTLNAKKQLGELTGKNLFDEFSQRVSIYL